MGNDRIARIYQEAITEYEMLSDPHMAETFKSLSNEATRLMERYYREGAVLERRETSIDEVNCVIREYFARVAAVACIRGDDKTRDLYLDLATLIDQAIDVK